MQIADAVFQDAYQNWKKSLAVFYLYPRGPILKNVDSLYKNLNDLVIMRQIEIELHREMYERKGQIYREQEITNMPKKSGRKCKIAISISPIF